jgi:DNA-binding transcriptional MerR regulator
MQTLRIGELAQATHVHLETSRYHEREGLMFPPERTTAGHRAYASVDLHRLLYIKRAQTLGFTLSEIRELLALRIEPDQPCAEVVHQIEGKLEEVKTKIAHLRGIEVTLDRMRASCAGKCTVSECPILGSLGAREPT